MNTGLTLRTAHITGGIAAVRAGATLLYDSIPDAEEKETHIKARALLETLAEAGRVAQGDAHPVAGLPSAGGRGLGFAPAILDSYAPHLVVLSPGPGRPADFGCAALLDEVYARDLPAFGVCLGLQAM